MVYCPLGSAPVAIAIRKSLHPVCFPCIWKSAKNTEKHVKLALADLE